MNTALALAMIGHSFPKGFRLETRSLTVDAGATLLIDEPDGLCWFPDDLQPQGASLTVESAFGVLETGAASQPGTGRERQHEHSGRIEVRNHGSARAHVTFITAIPR